MAHPRFLSRDDDKYRGKQTVAPASCRLSRGRLALGHAACRNHHALHNFIEIAV
jgi:hypothetical protein